MEGRSGGWSTQTKSFVILVILFCAGFLLYKFSAAITPLILAVILAFVLSPLVGILERRLHLPRTLATALVYLVLISVLILSVILLTPMLSYQVKRLVGVIREFFEDSKQTLGGPIDFAGLTINGPEVLNSIENTFLSGTTPLVSSALDIVAVLVESLIWVVFITVTSFYLVQDSGRIITWIDHLVLPPYRPDFVRLREEINIIWAAFFRGQLLLSLVVAAIITVLGLVIGMPYALVFGVLAGLLEFIPSVGHGIWEVLATLVALMVGSTWLPVPKWAFALLVLGIFLIYTQFDLNYLIPRIIGRSVHLPPLVVLLGIIAGASLGGILGVALAAPTIASLRVIMRYISSRLFDEAFPDDITTPQLPPPDLRWWHRRHVKHDPRD
jgi:predicted PurR-regulated permease PerM